MQGEVLAPSKGDSTGKLKKILRAEVAGRLSGLVCWKQQWLEMEKYCLSYIHICCYLCMHCLQYMLNTCILNMYVYILWFLIFFLLKGKPAHNCVIIYLLINVYYQKKYLGYSVNPQRDSAGREYLFTFNHRFLQKYESAHYFTGEMTQKNNSDLCLLLQLVNFKSQRGGVIPVGGLTLW